MASQKLNVLVYTGVYMHYLLVIDLMMTICSQFIQAPDPRSSLSGTASTRCADYWAPTMP